MSSKVGGIARAPVWGANPFLQIIAEVATTTSYMYMYFKILYSSTELKGTCENEQGHMGYEL